MNNGTNWVDAYNLLQDALEDAVSGDEIWVARGTYYPTLEVGATGTRYRTFQMKNGVEIIGGFPDSGSPIWEDRSPMIWETTLSGDIGIVDDNSDNCYHIFYHPSALVLDNSARLDGFTITDGNANSSGDHSMGGGMFNAESSPTLEKCTFTKNRAFNAGGGIRNELSNPRIIGCTFTFNSVEGLYSHGGGMDSYQSDPNLTNCIFTSNYAVDTGGGMHNEDGSATLTDCTFADNSADFSGGGMYNDSFHDLTSGNQVNLNRCIFRRNTSMSAGGGINTIYCNSTLTDCTFEENTTTSGSIGGGGVVNDQSIMKIIRCTFLENSATNSSGGGFFNRDRSDATVTDCIFTNNSAYYHGCGMYNQGTAQVINCTFNNNSGSLYMHSNGGGIADFYGQSLTVINSVFSNNTAGYGGGMFHRRSDFVNVVNCTFYGNWAGIDGAGIYNRDCDPIFTNSIIWANLGEAIYNYYGTADPNVTYSCIQGWYPGIGNIDENPMFSGSSLHLSGSSPCIDAGNNNALPFDTSDVDDDGDTSELIPFDRAYKLRRADDPVVDPDPGHAGSSGPPVVDMGAYEMSPVFVDDDASFSGDGRSWATAYKYLQDALYVAADPLNGRGEIRVAQGTYYPDQSEWAPVTPADRAATFEMQNNLALRGGYRGSTGGGDPDDRDVTMFESILSGDYANDDNPFDPYSNRENSYHVITSYEDESSAVLDGFVIFAGNANGGDDNNSGGGMYSYDSNPTILSCTFMRNSADYDGGGMFINYGSPTLMGCMFSGNVSHDDGGGISNVWSQPLLIDCIFRGNWALYQGGGMWNGDAKPEVINCSFIGNTAQEGGGMYNFNVSFFSSESATLTNCAFCANDADYGGGMYSSDTIADVEPTLSNCIFWGNSDLSGNDEGAQISGGDPTVTFSCIQELSTWSDPADHNIGTDPNDYPLFVRDPNDGGDGWGDDPGTSTDENANDDYGDLHLKPGSPCIDIGNNNADTNTSTLEIDPLPENDLDGFDRIIDGNCDDNPIVDMGAYEFNYSFMGSFDGDCDVDLFDFAIFSAAWVTAPGDPTWNGLCDIGLPADHLISLEDLALLVQHWLYVW